MKNKFRKSIRWLKAHRSQHYSVGIFVAFIIVFLFFLGSVVSPFLIPASTLGDGGSLGDSGSVGMMDYTYEIQNISNPVARFYYAAGDLNCHQMESRSFFLNGNQLPFCARDIAIFFGLAAGVLFALLFVFELNFLWLIIAFVPIALDGGLQLVTSYESTNIMRVLTGFPAGFATGLALGIIIRESADLIRWKMEVRKEDKAKKEKK